MWPPGVRTSAVPEDCPRFWVAANPAKAPIEGFLGHLANDGALCADDGDVERYLAVSAEKANACLVPLCVPLMGLVLASDVKSGDELLVTYGYDAWLRTPSKRRIARQSRTCCARAPRNTRASRSWPRSGAARPEAAIELLRTGSTEEKEAPPKRAKRKKKPTSGGFG